MKYILTIEAGKEKGWMDSTQLANDVDRYLANQSAFNNRPRVGAAVSNVKWTNKSQANGQTFKPPYSGPRFNNTASVQSSTASPTRPPALCWICNSPGHKAKSCTLKGTTPSSGSNSFNARPNNGPRRVNACVYGNAPSVQQQQPRQQQTMVFNRSSNPAAAVPAVDAITCTPTIDNTQVSTGVRPTAAAAVGNADDCQQVVAIQLNACNTNENGSLRYVDVTLASEPSCTSNRCHISGLYDSGAEISLVHPSVLQYLPDVEVVGKTQLCGVFGDPVCADLIKLSVSLHEGDQPDKFLNVLCASTDQTRHELILAADVVDRLMTSVIDACDCDECNTSFNVPNANDMNDAVYCEPHVVSVYDSNVDVGVHTSMLSRDVEVDMTCDGDDRMKHLKQCDIVVGQADDINIVGSVVTRSHVNQAVPGLWTV